MQDPTEGRGGPRQGLMAAALLAALAGCVEGGLERGFSGRDAEWARTHSPDDFAVVSANHKRAVVSALGHQIAVEPALGFCLAREAIETSDRSAFLLLGDCALEDPDGTALAGGDGLLDMPPGVPGIITVSISGDPGFSRRGAGAEEMAELQAFLESEEGRELLGRGGDRDQVSVVETRRIGDILYVLVEDEDGTVPILAPRFWRAFVELNERLAVVTVSGFRDRPLLEDEMLRHLGDQVRQLKVANSEPLDEIAVEMAELPSEAASVRGSSWQSSPPASLPEWPDEAHAEGSDAAEPDLITDFRPTSIIVATESGEQAFWPVPARRDADGIGQGGPAAVDPARLATIAPMPGRAADQAGWAGTRAGAAGAAPIAAPAAPRRP